MNLMQQQESVPRSPSVIPSLLGLIAGFILASQPVSAQHDPGRNAVRRLVRGDLDGTIDILQEDSVRHLDNEKRFIRAMVACERDNPEKAWHFAKKALESGLPITRFQAGPRDILQPLYKYEPYREYVKVHGKNLLQGPMLGSLTDTSVTVWVRTADASNVHVRAQAAFDSEGTQDAHRSEPVQSRPETDYTAKAELNGLKPDTTYSYQVYVDGEPAANRHLFETWPEQGRSAEFRIGMGACAGYTPKYERMWHRIQQYDLNGFLTLGDNVYMDDPKHPATQRYCYYRRQSRPEFRPFAASTSLSAIWDDHDFATNDSAGGSDPFKPEWKPKVWNVFKQNWVNPYYGGGSDQPGVWFDYKIADVHFIFLDNRYYRSNGQKDMLGTAQEEWLLETLESSDATFKLVASSVPFAPGVKGGNDDTWDGFPEQRDRIFSFIEQNDIKGVLFLAGDRHRTNIRRIPRENGRYFHELVSARLTNIHTHGLMKNANGSEFVVGYNDKPSFVILDVDTEQEPAEITVRCININGKEIFQHTFLRDRMYEKPTSNQKASQIKSQGERLDSSWFNRKNFVMDVSFTVPDKLDSDRMQLISEVGGAERGTVIGLRQGRLVITAGKRNSDYVTWTSDDPLKPGSRYTLRVNAISQNAGSNDTFTAHLLREDKDKARKLLHKKGLNVDGFAGSNPGGAGVANDSIFNPDDVPVRNAPDKLRISVRDSDTVFPINILPPKR